MEGHPHIINKIILDPLNLFDLLGLKPDDNQTVVTYKRGPTVTLWTLHLTYTTHLQNNSKTPILRMITL